MIKFKKNIFFVSLTHFNKWFYFISLILIEKINKNETLLTS